MEDKGVATLADSTDTVNKTRKMEEGGEDKKANSTTSHKTDDDVGELAGPSRY